MGTLGQQFQLIDTGLPADAREATAAIKEHFGDTSRSYPEYSLHRPPRSASGIAEGPAVYERNAQPPELVKYFGSRARWEPTGEHVPITHVYRAMSDDEWSRSQERGHIQSDERGVIIPGWEGTNATHDPLVARGYAAENRGGTGGVIAKIAVHPDDGWFNSSVDSYQRTRNPIPLGRVERALRFR